MFSSYVSIETRGGGEASVIEGAKIREALVGGTKNGRANKARFVERAQADPHLNYSARVRGRVTRTTCYASILSASRIKYETGCTCHYLITVTIRVSYRLVNGIQYRNTDSNRLNRVLSRPRSHNLTRLSREYDDAPPFTVTILF